MTNPPPQPPSELCPNCNDPIAIRNPSGQCDHLYYPDNVKPQPPSGEMERKIDIGALANCAMGKPMNIDQLLDPDFPINAVRVAEELARLGKELPYGCTWMAHGALTIISLFERVSSLQTSLSAAEGRIGELEDENALFLGAIDRGIDSMERMNRTLDNISPSTDEK